MCLLPSLLEAQSLLFKMAENRFQMITDIKICSPGCRRRCFECWALFCFWKLSPHLFTLQRHCVFLQKFLLSILLVQSNKIFAEIICLCSFCNKNTVIKTLPHLSKVTGDLKQTLAQFPTSFYFDMPSCPFTCISGPVKSR